MQATPTVATVTELVVLSSAMSFIRQNQYNYIVDCQCLVRAHDFVWIVFVYFMKITNEIPWFRVISRIPFQVGNSANSASFPRSRKITGPTPAYMVVCKYVHKLVIIAWRVSSYEGFIYTIEPVLGDLWFWRPLVLCDHNHWHGSFITIKYLAWATTC